MEYIKVTSENIDKEHICCAISNNNDIQVASNYNGYSKRKSSTIQSNSFAE